MSDQDVFNNDPVDPQDNTNPVAPSNELNEIDTMLASIKREDGTPKYKDVATALKALSESQAHIARLEQEGQQLRTREEELSRKAIEAETLQQIVDRLTQGQTDPKEPTPPSGKEVTNIEATVQQEVNRALQVREEQNKAANNLNQVNKEILTKFGEKSNEVVKAKAEELGITLEEFKVLAAKSPKLVLGHFNIASSGPTPTSPSSVNTTGLQPREPGLEKPSKSLLSGPGANTRDVVAFMKKIEEDVHKRYGITG